MTDHWCKRNRCISSLVPIVSLRSRLQGRGRTAAATVEFAIAAPVFFLFVLGMVEVGRGLMVQHLLLNAARQGCRTGILPSGGNSQISTAVADTLAPAGITAQNVTVSVNSSATDASSANSGDDITVTIAVPVSAVTWLPVSSFLSGNLSAQYTLRKQ
jgi:Flp pilus assembly protein TadG